MSEQSRQIRHRELGVYQGSFLGLGLWSDLSEQPEQGYCEFPSQAEAERYVDFLCTEANGKLERSDLTIEPYNRAESERMRRDGERAHAIREFQHRNRN